MNFLGAVDSMATVVSTTNMAARTKKKVNQDDLRKLMKERRENLKSTERKINSPHAKYNNVGQLQCTVCNLFIKNENLWPSHILSKAHKQNVEIAKEKEHSLYKPEPIHCNNGKRKADVAPPGVKKLCIRGKDSADMVQESEQRVASSNSSVISQRSVLQDYSSSEDESEEEEKGEEATASVNTSIPKEIVSGNLPPDFFDAQSEKVLIPSTLPEAPVFAKPAPPVGAKGKEKSGSGSNAESLPEGFFDDPVLDAKARNVEYKDPMEDEWEKFQKTIAEESHVSEAIMEEDVEESTAERDIDQIDQQIYNWSIVERLQSKVEEARLSQSNKESGRSSESDVEEEEEEYEDLLKNWRAKDVWKH